MEGGGGAARAGCLERERSIKKFLPFPISLENMMAKTFKKSYKGNSRTIL